MKTWIKKVINSPELFQTDQKTSQNRNKNKKVVVSFDKHEQKPKRIPLQFGEQGLFYKPQSQEYEQNYSPYRTSNISNYKTFDKDEYEQVNQQLKSSSKHLREKSDHKQKQNNLFKKNKKCQRDANLIDLKSQVNKNDDCFQQSQYQRKPSSSSERKSDNFTLQVFQEIVNNLISMQDLLKMVRHIPQIKGQYITLKYLNSVLSQEDINLGQLINYLLNKNSQGLNAYTQNDCQKNKQKTYTRLVKRLMGNRDHQSQKQQRKQGEIMKLYYRKFSNGLVYQYYPVRALVWKVVSGYLSLSKEKWIWRMEISLLKYRQLIKQHIVQISIKKKKVTIKNNLFKNANLGQLQPNQKTKQQNACTRKKSQSVSDPLSRLNLFEQRQKDHPLNCKQNSKWKTYFQDFDLWNLIQKDTLRTRQNNSFFKQPNLFSLTNDDSFSDSDLVKISLRNNEQVQFRLNQLHLSKHKKQCTTYVDAMTRIIFIYIKVNPEQKYHQGMNQLVALIYYSFTNKNNQYFRRVSQSDSYEIFSLLMQQLGVSPLHNPQNAKLPLFNHFINGQKYFDLLRNMIKKHDFRLYQFLSKYQGFSYLKVISIRWFMTIFLTQFSLDEALILWDCVMVLIGNKTNSKISGKSTYSLRGLKLTQFMLYMALAVVHLNRKDIFQQECHQNNSELPNTSNILTVFQKIKQKPEQIIEKSIALYKSFPNLLQ